MIQESIAIFLLAVAFDLILGEPPARIHPVVWIGRLISFLRAHARPTKAMGFALAAAVIIITVSAGSFLVWAAGPIPFLPILLSAYLLKSTFAIKCLLEVSSDIGKMIDQDMDEAKKMLPALVGRETATLSKAQAASAVIESLSENYVDSILSPIFYYLLFAPFGLGLQAALAFKAISTMDSMIGYKTKGLKELGFAGAKLDDVANFIPARLSILFMALARPGKAADTLKTAFQYHAVTPSPNSGWPMSACAGALGIRLEKQGFYILQEDGAQLQTSDIPKAIGFIKTVIGLTLAVSMAVLII